jgi:hypothetical protein
METMPNAVTAGSEPFSGEHERILDKIRELYREVFRHDGFGEIGITMRFLKRGQKEIIVSCGKEYRYVVDFPEHREEGIG